MKRQEKLDWYRNEFNQISKEIKDKLSLSYFDFLKIRNFKLQNSSIENEQNIKRISEEAFNLAERDRIKEAISKLLELNGVAIPIASTILAMKFPERYCIIDKRVIKQLKRNDWLKHYLKKPELYEEYLILMRNKAKEENKKLRDFERELFEKD